MICGLERHRAQLATIDSDNALVVDSWIATRDARVRALWSERSRWDGVGAAK